MVPTPWRGIAIVVALTAASPGYGAECPVLNLAQIAQGPMPVVQIVTGPDGESHFVDDVRRPESLKLFGGAFTLHKYLLAGDAKVTLVNGSPNFQLPFHPTPSPEMFLMLSGTVSMRLADGTHRDAGPGTLIDMEDMHSKKGHAGSTGPCGYVSMSISPLQAK